MIAQLDNAKLLELHRRMCDGDRRASEDFTQLFLSCFVAGTTRYLAKCDADFGRDGAVDALVDFCVHPEAFDPHGDASLEAFLFKAAWRNANKLIARERRYKARERRAAAKKSEIGIALDQLTRSIFMEDQDRYAKALKEILGPLNDKDRKLFELYLQGERSVSAFARVLGIEDWSANRQSKEVRRHKNRIRNFLKRHGLLP